MNDYSLYAWCIAWIFSISTVFWTFYDEIAKTFGQVHYQGIGMRQVIFAIVSLILAIWSWHMYYEWKD